MEIGEYFDIPGKSFEVVDQFFNKKNVRFFPDKVR